jgi:hypothetical protein
MKHINTRWGSFLVMVALCSSTSGCSFIFVSPPDERIRSAHQDCTRSRIAPGFDTAFATLQVIRTGIALSAADSVYENPDQPLSRGADVGLGLGLTALFVGSAVYGFANTSSCRALGQGRTRDLELDTDEKVNWDAPLDAKDRRLEAPAAKAPAPASPAESKATPATTEPTPATTEPTPATTPNGETVSPNTSGPAVPDASKSAPPASPAEPPKGEPSKREPPSASF